jgi:hypothetical protein
VVLPKPMIIHAILPVVGLAVKAPTHSTLVSVGASMPTIPPPPLMGGALVPAPGVSKPIAQSPFLRHGWSTPSTISITLPTDEQDVGRACNELARLREYACHVRHDDRACRGVAKIMRSLGCDLPTNIKPRLNLSIKLR